MSEFKERRKENSEILRLVREIHQRQQETVIPSIDNVKTTLYGNGKPGLCRDVAEIKTDLSVIETKTKTNAEDITGIKSSHWKYLTATISLVMLIVAIGGFIVNVMSKTSQPVIVEDSRGHRNNK